MSCVDWDGEGMGRSLSIFSRDDVSWNEGAEALMMANCSVGGRDVEVMLEGWKRSGYLVSEHDSLA